MDPQTTINVASCTLGLAVFLLASRIVLIVDRHVAMAAEDWEFEQIRRIKLRDGSIIYRNTEPLIDELAATRLVGSFNIPRIELSLNRGASPLPWQPREIVAKILIECLLLLIGIVFFGSAVLSTAICVGAALLLSGVYLHSAIKALHTRAEERIERIQLRMPFGIDLIALMLRAGASFSEALETMVRESREHPFSQEFQRVLDDLSHGRPLQEALGDMDERLHCEEVREIIFSICKSRELGTPLADIFVNLADQLRLKKSQWAEAAVGRAQVKLSIPNLLGMVACFLAILFPFLFGMLAGAS